MDCRTAHADGIARPSHGNSIPPLVLLAVAADDVRARFAYQLAACGFNVVTDVTNLLDACRPDVIVAEFDTTPTGGTSSFANTSEDPRLRGVPVIAVADDVSDLTQTLADRTVAPPSASPRVAPRHWLPESTPSSTVASGEFPPDRMLVHARRRRTARRRGCRRRACVRVVTTMGATNDRGLARRQCMRSRDSRSFRIVRVDSPRRHSFMARSSSCRRFVARYSSIRCLMRRTSSSV